jgi:predicted TIM-barrel fold metal-dependent hydrolase
MTTIPPVCFPPDPNPKTPKLKVPAGAWDCHFHVIGPPHRFPYGSFRNFTPPAAPIEHYLMVAKVLGFERGVLTQHSVHGLDTAITVDALRKGEGRLVGTILADPDLTPAKMKELHAAGVRAFRIELTSKLHGSYNEKAFNKVIKLAANAGWVVALHLDPPSILKLAEVIRKLPAPTILENFAHVDPREGLDQPALKTFVDLSKEPHIWLKTASLYRWQRRGVAYDPIVAQARFVHESAPDKVIWGTDWPHGDVFEPGQMANDGDLVDSLLDFVPDETIRRKLLVDNPTRLFGKL